MGGNGTIGGGRSCSLDFTINGVETKHRDRRVGKEFWVRVRFPDKKVVKAKINSRSRIHISWPTKAPKP